MRPYLDAESGDELTNRLFSDERSRVGLARCTEDIVNIVRQANENETQRASEAAWNGDVHTPLLWTSLSSSNWNARLRCDNVYELPST